MTDIRTLIQENRQELREHTQAVQNAKNEANAARSAWQQAEGSGKAYKKAEWKEACKERDAAVKERQQIRQYFQSLIERLPLPTAGQSTLWPESRPSFHSI